MTPFILSSVNFTVHDRDMSAHAIYRGCVRRFRMTLVRKLSIQFQLIARTIRFSKKQWPALEQMAVAGARGAGYA